MFTPSAGPCRSSGKNSRTFSQIGVPPRQRQDRGIDVSLEAACSFISVPASRSAASKLA